MLKVKNKSKIYRQFILLGKDVYAVCDKQTEENKTAIEALVKKLFMHEEKGFERLILKNTTSDAKERFLKSLDLPQHLIDKYPNPNDKVDDVLLEYFQWSKGNWGIADFLSQCNLDEIPQWLKQVCIELKKICTPNLPVNVKAEINQDNIKGDNIS